MEMFNDEVIDQIAVISSMPTSISAKILQRFSHHKYARSESLQGFHVARLAAFPIKSGSCAHRTRQATDEGDSEGQDGPARWRGFFFV